MSQENVEVVREVLDLFNSVTRAGDPGAGRELLARFSPEVRIDMTRRIFNPDVYEGHTGLQRLVSDVADV
jgi:hypothetical protein